MRQQTPLTMAGLLSVLSLLLTPTLLQAQADTVQPHVIGPEEGHTSDSPMGVRTEFMVGSVSTGGSQLFLARATLPPGHETPTHVHEIDEEVVCVLEGELTVILEGEERTVGPGGTAFVPPGTWMALANRTDAHVAFLGVISRAAGSKHDQLYTPKLRFQVAVAENFSQCGRMNR